MRRFILFLLVVGFAGGGVVFPQQAYAEDRKPPEPIGDIDLEKEAFSNTKAGCTRKASMFFALKKKYVAGVEAQDVFKAKVMEPLVLDVYKSLRDKGTEQATIDTMQEYVTCIKNIPRDESKTLTDETKYREKSCDQIRAMVLETAQAIKNRQKRETILNKYKNIQIDFEGTYYAGDSKAAQEIIKGMYDLAEDGSYERALEYGHSINMSCL